MKTCNEGQLLKAKSKKPGNFPFVLTKNAGISPIIQPLAK
jgi:hypothetical protein